MLLIESIILCVNFEVTLWMSANRADFGSFCSDNNVSASTTFPYLYFTFRENFGSFYVFQQSTVTLFMVLLDFSYKTKLRGKLFEAFFFCGFRKSVHS